MYAHEFGFFKNNYIRFFEKKRNLRKGPLYFQHRQFLKSLKEKWDKIHKIKHERYQCDEAIEYIRFCK